MRTTRSRSSTKVAPRRTSGSSTACGGESCRHRHAQRNGSRCQSLGGCCAGGAVTPTTLERSWCGSGFGSCRFPSCLDGATLVRITSYQAHVGDGTLASRCFTLLVHSQLSSGPSRSRYFCALCLGYGSCAVGMSGCSSLPPCVAMQIPLLETKADQRWGDVVAYQQYKRRTSVLVPLPPALVAACSRQSEPATHGNL